MTDYSEIGLGDNLIKGVEGAVEMIDSDLQIEDGSVRGVKLMTKSVPLNVLYGQDLSIGGDSNISGSLIVSDSSGIPRVTIDATNGINVTAPIVGSVFSTSISGPTVGDVTLGDYAGGQGIQYTSSPSGLSIQGNLTATTGVIGGWTINTNNITSPDSSIILDALNNRIVGGTILINQSSSSGAGSNAYLRWQGGSRMWEDNTGEVGVNAIQGTMIFYGNSSEIFQMNRSTVDGINNELAVTGRINCKGLYLNQGQLEGSVRKVDLIMGYNDLRFQVGDGGTVGNFKFLDSDGTQVASIEHDTGIPHFLSSTMIVGGKTVIYGATNNWTLNGFPKTAIVPTSKGYRALYTNESPELWFMDFCRGERKFSFRKTWKFWKWGFDWITHPDLMFLEVTVAPYVAMPTLMKGIVQLWGHRKGFEKTRFEEKTEEEFKKNNEFWSQAKLTKT